jgi:hypothetical protein
MTTGPWPRAKGSRQRVGRLELWPSSEGLPGCGLTAPLTWCSAGPLVTADARSAPQAAQRPCTYRVPKVASAQLQRLGEELVVGVLVLDVLHTSTTLPSRTWNTRTSILKPSAPRSPVPRCMPTVCRSSATTSCTDNSTRRVPAVNSIVRPKNPRTTSVPRWSPASGLRPGKCQTISGSNSSRRVSMSPGKGGVAVA